MFASDAPLQARPDDAPAAVEYSPAPGLPPDPQLTSDDLVQLGHLLPESGAALLRTVGIDAALALLRAWPGVQYPVPKHRDANAAGALRWAAIEAVVGPSAMAALVAQYGGGILEVPTCKTLLAEKRNRWLRQRFDDLTDLAGPALPASAAVYELGLALAEAGQPMTYREIEKRINRGDAAPPPQIDLFTTEG